MSNKIKKISINALEKSIGDINQYVTTEWHGLEIIIKKRLTLKEMMLFVDSVVKVCFTSDDNTYMPEIKDFAIRSNILEMYSNLTLPLDIAKKYNIIYDCDLVEIILENINRVQFGKMIEAIDEKIEHLANSNIKAITTQMNELYSSLAGMENKMKEIFGVLDKKDIDALLSAITNNKLDESKLMAAYIQQKNKGA